MPDLIAQGPELDQRWRRPLPKDVPFHLGRTAGDWATPWDERISRLHAELRWQAGRLAVETIEGARNPVFYRGRKADQFSLKPGEHFVIGATSFTLVDERAEATLEAPHPTNERTYKLSDLRRSAFRHPDQRIAALSRLPDIISGSSNDRELFVRLVSVLMSGVTAAKGAALVRVEGPRAPVEVLQWDRRAIAASDFRPSEKLIREALEIGESVVHVWNSSEHGMPADFTLTEGVDWAFCTPLGGSGCQGWAIYATGMFPADLSPADPEWLRDDLKFAELVAATFSSLREAQLLARRQAGLSQFLSPVVLQAIGSSDPDAVLAPREADVSVLFCDLRGFTSRSEQDSADLLGLLNRVSQALGVMTRHILGHGGVVGDFHGDAAMGFWGWPLSQADAIERACRAALAIRAEFEQAPRSGQSWLADFRIGIGIASGRAVAGKIGTVDQVKVTVFGPVVNLASRLENLTKTLQAPILIDKATAQVARARLTPAHARVRRVAKVRPLGIQTPLEVSELLPPGLLSDAHIATYESALDSLISGDWKKAFHTLHQVPAEDEVKDFLTVLIAQHGRTPPANWDGVISLREK
jgi:adenylate cyclase